MNTIVATVMGVGKTYGARPALGDMSLTVNGGECLALVGHNGCGKTTLIKILLGLVRPQTGSVNVLGTTPGAGASLVTRRRLGYLPENVAFDPGMTGRQVMAFYARLKGLPTADGEALLERVGLRDDAQERVRGYSKGMRQRLGLAQALLGDPEFLLLDEPTTGLDPLLRRAFYDLLREAKERGRAVLISSHALNELEGQADRVAILSQGRLLAEGTFDEIRRTADLPVHFTVRIQPCRYERIIVDLPAVQDVAKTAPDAMTITCRPAEKMALLGALSAREDVMDVEILAPSLDDIYAHFATEAA